MMHLVKLHDDIAAVAGLAAAAKSGPEGVAQNGASQVSSIALSENGVGNVDPLDNLRVGLVARPIAGRRVHVGWRVRNCVAVEADSDSQYVGTDSSAHGCQRLCVVVRRNSRSRHAALGSKLKLLLQFRF